MSAGGREPLHPGIGTEKMQKSEGCCRQELLSIREQLVKQAPAGDCAG
jgi:hypothetical protein